MVALKLVLIIALALLVYLSALYFIQDYLILYPQRKYISPQEAQTPEFQELTFDSVDGTPVYTWYAKGDSAKPAILFLHGNAGQNATFTRHLLFLVRQGYPVMIMEYRGYGKNKNRFDEKAVVTDAVSAYQKLKEKHKKVVVFGYSLGTGVAAGMLQKIEPDGLILLSPFYSMIQLVNERKIPFAKYLLKYPFRSNAYLPKLRAPLLLVHGRQDPLIPVHHGQQLLETAQTTDKTGVFLERQTHNSVFFEDGAQGVISDWLTDHFKSE